MKPTSNQYQQMFHHNQAIQVLVDPETAYIVDANLAAEKFYGYSLTELKKLRISDISLTPPEINQSLLQKAITREQSIFETRHRLADGSIRNVNVFTGSLEVEDRLLIYAVVNDITDKVFAEQQYQSLFEQFNDAVFIMDMDGKYVQVNQRAADMLGYTVEELLTTFSLKKALAPDEISRSENALQRLLRGEQLPPYERLFKHRSGRIFPVEINAQLVKDRDGIPLYIQSIARDISERKQMEQELITANYRLKMTLDGTNSGLWEWNVQTGETVYNERWAEIIGYTIAELSPISIDTWTNNAHPEDLERSRAILEKHFNHQIDFYEIECRMRHKDGHWVWIFARGKVMTWTADGKPLLMFGTHTDITDHKIAQAREFEFALEQERTRLITLFMQNAAHEFRTPLSIINSNAFILARTNDPAAKEKNYWSITYQVSRTSKLVDMLMKMLTIENTVQIKKAEINISSICKNIHMMFDQKFPNYTIEVHLQKDISNIWGSAEDLLDAIIALLDNATRYSKAGSVVKFRTYEEEEHIFIVVEDQGIGIKPEDIPHIFETFWRNDEAHSTPGLGLGLSLAQRIAQLHDGTIRVRSVVDEGSTFEIMLPISSKEDVYPPNA